MKKIIVAIGGGEIKNKTTLEIDRYIAGMAKARAAEQGRRAVGVFFGTASHDSMPYFNSFRKTYTSVFDIKAEAALSVYGEMTALKIAEKIDKADFVYVGGGDTLFMLTEWKNKGIDVMLKEAYDGGKIIAGLSAGAVCWFRNAYSDYEIMGGSGGEYKLLEGLGFIDGTMCPHYNFRPEFDEVAAQFDRAFAVENDCALVFEDGMYKEKVSAGGKAFIFERGEKREL